MMPDSQPTNVDEAQADLTKCLETQARYDYTYIEYLGTSLIRCLFSCCCKRMTFYRKRAKRLMRHEAALEQLIDETDFFTFLKQLRTVKFMSHVYLKDYQRKLIPYFKSYQLTELEGDKVKQVFDTAMLGSAAHLSDRLFEDLETAMLREKQLNLLETVQNLNSWESPADLAILYEVTGFQIEPVDDEEFWNNYEKYREVDQNGQMAINEEDVAI